MAAAVISRLEILSLYKQLLRASNKFKSYNNKMYAVRRVKDAFKEGKELTDSNKVSGQFQYGKENLDIIKRQAAIGGMFATDKLIIEK